MVMAEEICTANADFIENIRRTRKFTQPLHKLIHYISGLLVPPEVDLVSFSNYKSREHGTPTHLKNRIDSYISQALQAVDIYLAEVVLPYGKGVVHLLVKMTKGRDGSLCSSSSVIWVSSTLELPH
ncbi:hypothetical protein EST38_g14250 [Candolleomyces aberdarensis]|uniref:Uncharacterized protein n=1 Tax=Candolleomyces aberdarensis TaxID=2316362 RepID=A0A4Q2D0F6_9AGAR|nr:hypothetical protein EST38_g14250 [Candolleomyces aberdarensis]